MKFQYITFFLLHPGYSKVTEQVHMQFLEWQEAPLPLPCDFCHEAEGAESPSCLSLGCLHMDVAGNFFFVFKESSSSSILFFPECRLVFNEINE